MTAIPAYRHVQIYTVMWVLLPALYALGLALLTLAKPVPATTWLYALMPPVTALVFGRLVIEIVEGQLRWRFGYLPWPRWLAMQGWLHGEVALAQIDGVQRLREAPRYTSGIHGPREDRVWNVTIGGPAVRLKLADGRHVTLGTPEPERLAAFIEARRRG
jgi:hypothetical protein